MTRSHALSPQDISAVIQMALCDHTSFDTIRDEYGLAEKDVQALMRAELKTGSYKAWRRRVRQFADRRERYK